MRLVLAPIAWLFSLIGLLVIGHFVTGALSIDIGSFGLIGIGLYLAALLWISSLVFRKVLGPKVADAGSGPLPRE